MSAPPVAVFATLDEAESALDWIGVDFTEGEGSFEGVLSGDDRDLLLAAVGDEDSPGAVRDLARSLLGRWNTDGGDTVPFVVRFGEDPSG